RRARKNVSSETPVLFRRTKCERPSCSIIARSNLPENKPSAGNSAGEKRDAAGAILVVVRSRLRCSSTSRKVHRFAKTKVTVLIFAAAVITSCRAAAPSCPPGTKLMGEAPPKGSETWCAKTINGEQVKEGPFVLYRDNGSKMLEGEYHNG